MRVFVRRPWLAVADAAESSDSDECDEQQLRLSLHAELSSLQSGVDADVALSSQQSTARTSHSANDDVECCESRYEQSSTKLRRLIDLSRATLSQQCQAIKREEGEQVGGVEEDEGDSALERYVPHSAADERLIDEQLQKWRQTVDEQLADMQSLVQHSHTDNCHTAAADCDRSNAPQQLPASADTVQQIHRPATPTGPHSAGQQHHQLQYESEQATRQAELAHRKHTLQRLHRQQRQAREEQHRTAHTEWKEAEERRKEEDRRRRGKAEQRARDKERTAQRRQTELAQRRQADRDRRAREQEERKEELDRDRRDRQAEYDRQVSRRREEAEARAEREAVRWRQEAERRQEEEMARRRQEDRRRTEESNKQRQEREETERQRRRAWEEEERKRQCDEEWQRRERREKERADMEEAARTRREQQRVREQMESEEEQDRERQRVQSMREEEEATARRQRDEEARRIAEEVKARHREEQRRYRQQLEERRRMEQERRRVEEEKRVADEEQSRRRAIQQQAEAAAERAKRAAAEAEEAEQTSREERHQRHTEAAVTVQRIWRGWRVRRADPRMSHWRRQRQERSAVDIQRVWRGWRARRRVRAALDVITQARSDHSPQQLHQHNHEAATSAEDGWDYQGVDSTYYDIQQPLDQSQHWTAGLHIKGELDRAHQRTAARTARTHTTQLREESGQRRRDSAALYSSHSHPTPRPHALASALPPLSRHEECKEQQLSTSGVLSPSTHHVASAECCNSDTMAPAATPSAANAWGLTSPAALAALRAKESKMKRMKANKTKQHLSSTQRLERMQQQQQQLQHMAGEARLTRHSGARHASSTQHRQRHVAAYVSEVGAAAVEDGDSDDEWSESREEERGRHRPDSADSNSSSSLAAGAACSSRFPSLPPSPTSVQAQQLRYQHLVHFGSVSVPVLIPELSPAVARLVSAQRHRRDVHPSNQPPSTLTSPTAAAAAAGREAVKVRVRDHRSNIPPAWLTRTTTSTPAGR